jgi:hypothetical protein
VIKIEIIFSYKWRVGVGWSGEGSLQWWYEFNASVSTREGRKRDKTLSEDEAEAASLSCLNEQEALHGVAA